MVTTKYDLGIEYLGGLTRPTADDVGKLAVVALDALGNPNFEYLEQTASVADDTFATTLAPFLRGVGLTVDSSGNLRPRPRPRRLQLQDFFISGNTTSGSIGGLGWNLFGTGTPAVSRSGVALSSSSRFSLVTSAAANNRSCLKLGETETRDTCVVTDYNLIQCCLNHNNQLTDKRVFFGFLGDFATEAAAAVDCLGIYYDSAVSANYQIIARSSSVGSPVVTSQVVEGNVTRILTIYQPTAGTFQFYVGNTLVGSISSGVPTAVVDIGWRIETLAAATATVRLGYFGAAADIGQQFDDDAFLEV